MRKVLAAFMAVCFVFPLFMAALVTIGVSTWALDRDLYARVLSDSRLYEIPTGAKIEGFLYWPWTPELGAVPLSAASIALKEVITPEYMRTQAVSFLNASFDFMDGRSQVFDPSIDLSPVKKALRGEGGKRFARALAEALPACSSQSAFVLKNGVLPGCRPTSVSVTRAADAILQTLPTTIAKIPDSFRVNDDPSPLLDRRHWEIGWGFPALRALIVADLALMFIACCAWLLAAVIGGRDARGRLYWLGGSLLPPAVVVFLIGLMVNTGIVADAARYGIESARLSTLGFSRSFITGLFGAAGAMIGRVAAGFLATGAIAVGIAVALLFWGRSRPRAEDTVEPQQPLESAPPQPQA
jgi:hypothetical protein